MATQSSFLCIMCLQYCIFYENREKNYRAFLFFLHACYFLFFIIQSYRFCKFGDWGLADRTVGEKKKEFLKVSKEKNLFVSMLGSDWQELYGISEVRNEKELTPAGRGANEVEKQYQAIIFSSSGYEGSFQLQLLPLLWKTTAALHGKNEGIFLLVRHGDCFYSEYLACSEVKYLWKNALSTGPCGVEVPLQKYYQSVLRFHYLPKSIADT